jgi:hypothetical protein
MPVRSSAIARPGGMQWILQQADLRDGDAVARLSYAIEEQGMRVHVVPFVPFGAMDWSFVDTAEPVFVYGSIAMVKDASARCPGAPVAFADFERLRCSAYYPRYRAHLLQAEHRFVALGALRSRIDVLTRELGEDELVFVRPDENDKGFDGQLVHRASIADFVTTALRFVDAQTVCVVARPMSLEEEWRLFVAEGRVIAASQYRSRRSVAVVPGAPDEVVRFAEARAAEHAPHPVFVIDVGRVGERLLVVEIGSASCAGLYACDVRAIARGVRAAIGS